MSTMPDITQYQIANESISELVNADRLIDARNTAQLALAEQLKTLESAAGIDRNKAMVTVADWLSDLGCVLGMLKDPENALKPIIRAKEINPLNARYFHNLVTLLCQSRELSSKNYRAVLNHLDSVQSKVEWASDYMPLQWMPTFLNLEFVGGKCNLKCRMCIGTNAKSHPNKFYSMSVDEFREALQSAPTITGVTLSSGDSEPLLHPRFTEIVDIAEEHNVTIDLFTNGLPLTEKKCQHIINSNAVTMINFSIDAATRETYERIRGGDFDRLHANIRMLRDLKSQHDTNMPWISLSFVAMADNIQELPDIVTLAQEYGAKRIFVEDLLGWLGKSNGNLPAIDNPRCAEYVQAAQALAADAGIYLQLPERLIKASPAESEPSQDKDTTTNPEPALDQSDNAPSYGTEEFTSCSWLNGAWVSKNGNIQPCCMLHNVADMGNIREGALYRNEKFNRVKSLLKEGKVFDTCADIKCPFIQQEHARGRTLRFITRDELGGLDLTNSGTRDQDASSDAIVSLPVLQSA